MPAYLVLGLLFSIAVAVFAVQNATRVDITLFFWQMKNISLVLVILGSALLGALTVGLFGAVKQIRLSRNLKNMGAQLETRRAEIEYLQEKLQRHEQEKLHRHEKAPDTGAGETAVGCEKNHG